MKIRKNPAIVCFIIFGALLCCAGCAKENETQETTLFIKKDQSLVSAIVEEWKEDYLDDKELKERIDQEVKEFTQGKSEDSVKLEEFEIADQKAKVDIFYDSVQSYAEFNNVAAFNGTVEQAQKSGFELTGEFASAKDKPSVSLDELDGSKEYQILILSEKLKISMEKEILYYSSNVKVEKDGKTASVDANSGQYAYIIYK